MSWGVLGLGTRCLVVRDLGSAEVALSPRLWSGPAEGGVPRSRESGSPARRALLNWCHLRPHGGRRTTSVRTLALHGGRQRSSGTEPDGTTLGIGQIVTRRGRYRGHEASCS